MADLTVKKSNFISRTVAAVTALLTDVEGIQALRQEWDALGYSPGSGPESELSPGDCNGANAHVSPAILADAFNSLEALKTLLLDGHLTNLSKLRP